MSALAGKANQYLRAVGREERAGELCTAERGHSTPLWNIPALILSSLNLRNAGPTH